METLTKVAEPYVLSWYHGVFIPAGKTPSFSVMKEIFRGRMEDFLTARKECAEYFDAHKHWSEGLGQYYVHVLQYQYVHLRLSYLSIIGSIRGGEIIHDMTKDPSWIAIHKAMDGTWQKQISDPEDYAEILACFNALSDSVLP